MPLTPQDVRDKMFTSVRFKQGYDEDEVDAFLDRVEEELTRLASDKERLTAEFSKARVVSTEPVAEWGGAERAIEVPDDAPRSAFAPSPSGPLAAEDMPADLDPEVAGPPVPAPIEAPLPPPSPTEDALRRTLVLAQRTADAAIAEARAEAAAMIEGATTKAEETERVSRLHQATREHDHQVEFERLQAAVEQLRGFEREYRGRLKAYLHLQMRELEDSTPAEPSAVAGVPARTALGSGAPRQEAAEDAEFPDDPDFGAESGHFTHADATPHRHEDLAEPQ